MKCTQCGKECGDSYPVRFASDDVPKVNSGGRLGFCSHECALEYRREWRRKKNEMALARNQGRPKKSK